METLLAITKPVKLDEIRQADYLLPVGSVFVHEPTFIVRYKIDHNETIYQEDPPRRIHQSGYREVTAVVKNLVRVSDDHHYTFETLDQDSTFVITFEKEETINES